MPAKKTKAKEEKKEEKVEEVKKEPELPDGRKTYIVGGWSGITQISEAIELAGHHLYRALFPFCLHFALQLTTEFTLMCIYIPTTHPGVNPVGGGVPPFGTGGQFGVCKLGTILLVDLPC